MPIRCSSPIRYGKMITLAWQRERTIRPVACSRCPGMRGERVEEIVQGVRGMNNSPSI